MENRSVLKVFLLSIVTFGIYALVWGFWTTKELNAKGANIPTPWLQIIPIANLYWLYKYYEGADQVTGGKVGHVMYFLLAFFITPILSLLLAQNEYNNMGAATPAQAPLGGAPAQPSQPSQVTGQASANPGQQVIAPQQPASPEQPVTTPQPQPTAPAQPTPQTTQAPAAPEAPPVNNDVQPPQPPQPPLVQ